MTNQSLVKNLKEHGTGTMTALRRKLIHLPRRNYSNTTPGNAWKFLFCRLPVNILKNKVYSNTMLWVRDGMKGMMVNQFIVMWPLFIAGHVDRLDDPKKREMASNFCRGCRTSHGRHGDRVEIEQDGLLNGHSCSWHGKTKAKC